MPTFLPLYLTFALKLLGILKVGMINYFKIDNIPGKLIKQNYRVLIQKTQFRNKSHHYFLSVPKSCIIYMAIGEEKVWSYTYLHKKKHTWTY